MLNGNMYFLYSNPEHCWSFQHHFHMSILKYNVIHLSLYKSRHNDMEKCSFHSLRRMWLPVSSEKKSHCFGFWQGTLWLWNIVKNTLKCMSWEVLFLTQQFCVVLFFLRFCAGPSLHCTLYHLSLGISLWDFIRDFIKSLKEQSQVSWR